jgi:hypothetical protein
VQPKLSPFQPTPPHASGARERLVGLARRNGVELGRSYERVGKHALIAHQRYAHAKQFKRAQFGVKVSIAATLNRSKGGQFISHAKALPGNFYDGHTLATVIPQIEAQIGAPLTRIVADRGRIRVG